VQHILTTPSGVFLMPFVCLVLLDKEKQQTCATFLTAPSGVFLMPCVFLSLPGEEKQQTCVTHSYTTLWCVSNASFVFTLPGSKDTRLATHSYKPSGVFFNAFVFLAPHAKETGETRDLCNTFLQHPLVCF
jgi:hypothetical protein